MTADRPSLMACAHCGETNASVLPPTCDKRTPYNPADRAFPVVRCSCGVEVGGKDWDQSSKSAIAAWNRRAAPPLPAGFVAVPGELGAAYPSEDHGCVYEDGDGPCRECCDLAALARNATHPAEASAEGGDGAPVAWRWRIRKRGSEESWGNWRLSTCQEYDELGRRPVAHFETEFQPLGVLSEGLVI